MAVDLDLLSDEMAKAYRALTAQSVQPGDFVKTYYDPVSETVKQSVIKQEDVEHQLQCLQPATQQSVGALGFTSPIIASPGPPKPASSEPMINWEKMAGVYAAALAEANAKVRELEADLQRSTQAYAEVIAKLTAKPEQAPPTKSQQIAAALRFDPLPGSYAR